MKPFRVVKSFADLREVIAAVAAEEPPVAAPPMTPDAVKRAAQTFVKRHKREASKVVVLRPR